MHLERAFETIALLAALRAGGRARAERVITANPSAGNYVHYENTATRLNLNFPPDLSVNSNVPVTLSRYSDSGTFFDGQKPIRTNEVTVVVKSDCSTDVTDVIPQVEISDDGQISVRVSGVDGIAGSGMPFLDEPSYFSVFWTWVDSFCGGGGGFGGGGLFTPPATVLPVEEVIVEDLVSETDIVQCIIPGTKGVAICDEGQYCKEEVGVCVKPLDLPSGKCTEKSDFCPENWAPVCGCNAQTYANECEASSYGVSVNYEGECKPVKEPIEAVTIPSIPEDVTIPTIPSIPQDGIAAAISTEAASSNAVTTESAQAGTQATVPASGDANPTLEPKQDSDGIGDVDVEPSEINEPDEFSSGFVRRRPSSLYAAFILLAVVALASFFPTSGNGGLIGKFAVVALAVSSHRRRNSGSQTSSHKNNRVLQTCNYNVELLYDACTHSVNVQAPKTRTVDAVIEDVSRSASSEDKCIDELAANLTFPSSGAEELDGTDITVAHYEQFVSGELAESFLFILYPSTYNFLRRTPRPLSCDCDWKAVC